MIIAILYQVNPDTRIMSNFMMKAYKLFFYCLFLALSNSAFPEDSAPVTFKAIYKLYASGLEIAESVREVSHSGNDEYNYRSESHTVGLVSLFHKDHIIENSLWKFSGNELIPIDYTYVRNRGKKDRQISVHFDWEKKILSNRINDSKIELPLTEGMLDKLSYQYALMHDLRENQFQSKYMVADARKIKTYHFEQAGEETITTPLGNIQTIKIDKVSDDDTSLSIWCAPRLQYLPVKIKQTEEDGQVITTVLQKVEGL